MLNLALLALQVVLPLALLAALALRTPTTLAGFWLHIGATAMTVLAVAVAGIWTLLPWWTPYTYAAALLAIGAGLYGARDMPTERWPAGLDARAHLILCVGLALGAAFVCVQSLRARSAPSSSVLDLHFPLPAGDYLVVHGGTNAVTNANALSNEISARYGVELVRLDTAGMRARSLWPSDPQAYLINDTPVLAPCDGTVIQTHSATSERAANSGARGTFVRIRCADAVVTLAHLRADSVEVRAGQAIADATPIARVGDVANAREPALRVYAERAGKPLALRFNGRIAVRNDRINVAPQTRAP